MDNSFVEGIVEIKSSTPSPSFFPNINVLVFWIIVLLAAVAGLIFQFLIFVLERIRRKRKRRRPTFTIIVHPHI